MKTRVLYLTLWEHSLKFIFDEWLLNILNIDMLVVSYNFWNSKDVCVPVVAYSNQAINPGANALRFTNFHFYCRFVRFEYNIHDDANGYHLIRTLLIHNDDIFSLAAI